jgi:hypothetical protein
MTVCTRRCCLAALAGLIGFGAGCGDMGSLAYFLTPEQPLPAKMKHLASEDPKKEPRVVILTYAGLQTQSEFIHADRQLGELLAGQLQQLAETQKQRLAVVPIRKVEDFKNANPNWREMDLDKVGRKLGADYVVYIEISSLSLYETGSRNMLYRGRANLLVSLVDVNRPDDQPPPDNFSTVFPSDARGPIPVGIDAQPMQFRQAFLRHVGRQLSLYFSNYPRSENRIIDPPL